MISRYSHNVMVLVGVMLLTWVPVAYMPHGLAEDEIPGTLIFSEDFSQDVVGDKPSRWSISGNNVFIVEVDDAAQGKAVQIVGDPQRATQISVQLAVNAPAVMVEHALWWVKGPGLNYYLDSVDVERNMHNVNWYVSGDGNLHYRWTNEAGKAVTPMAGKLEEGWNVIRILAHAERNEAYVFLNDFSKPALGPLPFRVPVDEWTDAKLIFYDTGRSDSLAETYYDDVKVWRLEPEEANELFSSLGAASASEPVSSRARESVWAGDLPAKPAMKDIRPRLDIESYGVNAVTFMSFPLQVEEYAGIERKQQPLSSGVPFPEGHLWSDQNVRLMDRDGNEVPLQTEVLAWWPDGSIRWLLLTFQTDVPAWDTKEFTLEYGRQLQRGAKSSRSVKVSQSGGAVTVDTGPLKWSLAAGSAPAKEGETWSWAGAPLFEVRDADGFVYTSTGDPQVIEVEESGPERAIVRIRGELVPEDPKATALFAYDLRLYFYQGHATVRIDPVITNLRAHEREQVNAAELRQVSLRLPKWLAGGGTIDYETDVALASHIRSRMVAGSLLPTPSGQEGTSESRQKVAGQASAAFRLVQENVMRLHIVDDSENVLTNHRSGGWVSLQRGDRQVTVGVRHFWEQFPKGIEVTPEGDVWIHLWPDDEHILSMDGGESKRHEVYVSLDPDANLAGWLNPLLAAAEPKWYSETAAFGQPLFLYEPELLPLMEPSVVTYETRIQEGFKQLLENREVLDEYGWRNFGDWATTWDPNGWGNTEYDMARAMFLQFARTGDLEYLHFAEHAARHWMDVDIIWASRDTHWLGGGIEHSSGHRDKATDAGHTWLQGLVDYYLLTGDRRSLESARLIGDWFARLAFERPSGGPRLHNRPGARRPGWAMIGLMRLAQLGDPYYLDAARAVVEILKEEQTPDGQWTYGIPEAELPGAGQPQLTKTFMTALTLRGLVDYERMTGDSLAQQLLIKGTRFIVDNLWDYEVGGFQYIDHPNFPPTPSASGLLMLDALVRTYELTGEERFLQVARRAFAAYMDRVTVRRDNFGKDLAMLMRQTPESMVGFVEGPQPYALSAEAPARIYMGKDNVLPVAFSRLDVDGPFTGTFRLEDLPDGMTAQENPVTIEITTGERNADLDFVLAINHTVTPGVYTANLREETSGLSTPVQFSVVGWQLTDGFRPPLETGWFADVVSFSLTAAESDGWMYVGGEGTPGAVFAHRKARKAATEEYLLYDAPALLDFSLEVFMPEPDTEQLLTQVEVWVGSSPDAGADDWTQVALAVQWEDTENSSLAKATVSPETRLTGDADQLKIVAKGPGAAEWPQLNLLRMAGWGKP